MSLNGLWDNSKEVGKFLYNFFFPQSSAFLFLANWNNYPGMIINLHATIRQFQFEKSIFVNRFTTTMTLFFSNPFNNGRSSLLVPRGCHVDATQGESLVVLRISGGAWKSSWRTEAKNWLVTRYCFSSATWTITQLRRRANNSYYVPDYHSG